MKRGTAIDAHEAIGEDLRANASPQPTLLDTAGASHLCHERKYFHARKAGTSYDLARKLTVGNPERLVGRAQ
jgi:hypothetical protein